jgi:Carbohydrate binding domain
VASNGGGTSTGADSTFTTLPITPPSVTTGSATSIGLTTATITGTVNPNGFPTTYHFMIRLAAGSPLSWWPNPVPDADAGSGTTPVPVSVNLSVLGIDVAYEYRLVATNSGGTTEGPDSTFRTLKPTPVVTTGAATLVTTNSATLNGTINPSGVEAAYYFEYGLTTAHGSQAPVPEGSLPAGSNPTAVRAPVSGLTINTEYHFRLVALNGYAGTQNGADMTFKTLENVPVVSLLQNPGFESGLPPWVFFTNASGFYNNDVPGPSSPRAAHVEVTTAGTNIQLYQTGFPLESGVAYRLTFKAYSSTGHDVAVFLNKHGPDYSSYGLDGSLFDLGTTYRQEFLRDGDGWPSAILVRAILFCG